MDGIGRKTEEPQPAPSLKPCDLDATGSASDFYGVPQGSNMRGFHDKKGPTHPGYDVQRLRGAQVFANLRDRIPLAELRNAKTEKGVAIPVAGTGDAELVEASVRVQPWDKPEAWMYGGVIGLNATYRYHDDAGTERSFRIYTEYLQLITTTHLPRDDENAYVNAQGELLRPGESYAGCSGFGSKMKTGTVLSAAQLGGHPLIGFLGATISPHVHIEAWFAADPAIADRRVKPAGILFDPGVAVGGHP